MRAMLTKIEMMHFSCCEVSIVSLSWPDRVTSTCSLLTFVIPGWKKVCSENSSPIAFALFSAFPYDRKIKAMRVGIRLYLASADSLAVLPGSWVFSSITTNFE